MTDEPASKRFKYDEDDLKALPDDMKEAVRAAGLAGPPSLLSTDVDDFEYAIAAAVDKLCKRLEPHMRATPEQQKDITDALVVAATDVLGALRRHDKGVVTDFMAELKRDLVANNFLPSTRPRETQASGE